MQSSYSGFYYAKLLLLKKNVFILCIQHLLFIQILLSLFYIYLYTFLVVKIQIMVCDELNVSKNVDVSMWQWSNNLKNQY